MKFLCIFWESWLYIQKNIIDIYQTARYTTFLGSQLISGRGQDGFLRKVTRHRNILHTKKDGEDFDVPKMEESVQARRNRCSGADPAVYDGRDHPHCKSCRFWQRGEPDHCEE